jgi:ribosomal protein S2
MFGLLTRKTMDEYIATLLNRVQDDRLVLENEQDKLLAALKAMEHRVAVLEDRHLGGFMTPEEVEEQLKKRVKANRYARDYYREQKAKKEAIALPVNDQQPEVAEAQHDH